MIAYKPRPSPSIPLEAALGLRAFEADKASVACCLAGKVAMVTGAGGSIGSELCFKIAEYRPQALIGLDQGESALFETEQHMRTRFPEICFVPWLCDIQNEQRLTRVITTYQPEVVYHAAAYKHVPMLETHQTEAVENNVFGTLKVVKAALSNGCKRFTLISTDKAVKPISILGATKRLAELVCLAQATRTRESTVNVVRFGNVLNSNGSVSSVFAQQIAAGGPVTVTHPEMHRYFLTTTSAVNFVLEASTTADTGQVFELDLGDSIPVLDVVRKMIELAGLQPGVDIQIKFTGIRPGEKLNECQGRYQASTSDAPLKRCIEENVHPESISRVLDQLQKLIESDDRNGLDHFLRQASKLHHP